MKHLAMGILGLASSGSLIPLCPILISRAHVGDLCGLVCPVVSAID